MNSAIVSTENPIHKPSWPPMSDAKSAICLNKGKKWTFQQEQSLISLSYRCHYQGLQSPLCRKLSLLIAFNTDGILVRDFLLGDMTCI